MIKVDHNRLPKAVPIKEIEPGTVFIHESHPPIAYMKVEPTEYGNNEINAVSFDGELFCLGNSRSYIVVEDSTLTIRY